VCGEYETVTEILPICHRECECKRQDNINKVTCSAQGPAIMAIQVDEGGGLVTYDTHEDIV
jgi:hypothetical protein